MTILSKNIRFLRKQHEWSQDFIAEKLGYKSYTTIQKWEMGTSEPPLKKLKELSDLFSVDIDDMANTDLETQKQRKDSTSANKGIQIPVLGRVAAGIPITATEYIIDTEEISETMAADGEYFALQIKGDSMEPKISDGDVVIVRRQSDADDGDLVIALVNGDDAVCKRLKRYADGIALLSNNPVYGPMYFNQADVDQKPVSIIGKVKELRAKF